MVPWRAQPGDVICVFVGPTMPFAIRKKGSGNYILMGECYIYELVDGEALDMLPDRDDLELGQSVSKWAAQTAPYQLYPT